MVSLLIWLRKRRLFKFLNHNIMSELQVKTMAEFMAEGKEADILFWVGSAGSFDERAQKITRAFVTILNKCIKNSGGTNNIR